jgi:hypothetical protein
MRTRIKTTEKIDIQNVINDLEHKRSVYSEMLRYTMKTEKCNYTDAKKSLHFKVLDKILFKC